MKHMQPKLDSDKLVREFLQRGGHITKCPAKMPKPLKTQPVGDLIVVEIDTDALPPELRKFIALD